MFTGIIEEVGRLERVQSTSQGGRRLWIGARKVLQGTIVGESIAVEGVCLTVAQIGQGLFAADVMPQTLRISTLGRLKARDPVNLERALRLADRLGGHLVSGHIDACVPIQAQYQEKEALWLRFGTPAELLRYIPVRASVAIDGISLTVAGITKDSFSVSLIPTTQAHTTLKDKKAGDWVNLECDQTARYLEQLLTKPDSSPTTLALDKEFLAAHGFRKG